MTKRPPRKTKPKKCTHGYIAPRGGKVPADCPDCTRAANTKAMMKWRAKNEEHVRRTNRERAARYRAAKKAAKENGNG